MVGSAVALSRVEREACFERLLLDDDEECKELKEVFGRRLRFAKALLVLSRASAAMDSRLFLACGRVTVSLSRLSGGGCCVLGGNRWAVVV